MNPPPMRSEVVYAARTYKCREDLKAVIYGNIFLRGAGNKEFFQSAGLSFEASVEPAELARETSKYYLSCYERNSDS
jgi:hypothetical protein